MTRSSRQSSSQGTACGSWIRAWSQHEPPHEQTGRLKKARHDGRARSRVGWTSLLLTPDAAHFAWNARSGRSRAAFGHALGESALLGLLHIALSSSNSLLVVLQPIEQGPGHGAVRVEVDLPSPESGTCAQHKRPGFLTACDHAERPPGLACDKPVAQYHGSATQIQSYSVQHIACVRGHKRAERGSRRSTETVGSVRPTEHER
jgi:hypothetical protein